MVGVGFTPAPTITTHYWEQHIYVTIKGDQTKNMTQGTTSSVQRLYIAPSSRIVGQPLVPSSKYYTLRYLLAATLADGESRVFFPATSDDSDALFRGCRALGAELSWEDEQHTTLCVRGVGSA